MNSTETPAAAFLRRLKPSARAAAAVAFGLAALLPATAVATCPAGTPIDEYVPGGGLCLAAATYGASSAGASPALVVVLHGDVSSGGPADYHFWTARNLAGPGADKNTKTRMGGYLVFLKDGQDVWRLAGWADHKP